VPDYRRWRIEGAMYFLTLVTHERQPILCTWPARQLLSKAISAVREKRPFDITAIVLLPDHIHVILHLPEGDANYSTRIALIKKHFTVHYVAAGGTEGATSDSRLKHRIRGCRRSASMSTRYGTPKTCDGIQTTYMPILSNTDM